MKPKLPWYYSIDWATHAIVWALSLASLLGLRAYALPDYEVRLLIVPAIQGSIICMAMVGMHFYTRRHRRRHGVQGNNTKNRRRRAEPNA